MHNFWCEPQQSLQGVGQELPREQEADAGRAPIVLALASAPQHLEEPGGDVSPREPVRVRPASGPVDPGQAPVRVHPWEPHVHKSGKVMLVSVAGVLAEPLEHREVLGVRDDLDSQVPVHLEPLGPLPPVPQGDIRVHVGAVPSAAHRTWEVVDLHEGLGGVGEVRVDGGEVEQGDARLRQKDEPLIRDVEEGVCQEPPLGFDHVDLSPLDFLEFIRHQHSEILMIRKSELRNIYISSR